jgi:hypothetical protein
MSCADVIQGWPSTTTKSPPSPFAWSSADA